MKSQFAEHLHEMKFIDSKNVKADSSNRNSRNEALVRAVICAGLYPNVAKVKNINSFLCKHRVVELTGNKPVQISST